MKYLNKLLPLFALLIFVSWSNKDDIMQLNTSTAIVNNFDSFIYYDAAQNHGLVSADWCSDCDVTPEFKAKIDTYYKKLHKQIAIKNMKIKASQSVTSKVSDTKCSDCHGLGKPEEIENL